MPELDFDILETNFKRLLERCESFVKGNETKDITKFVKYVETLENNFKDLETNQVPQELLRSYDRRLKGVIRGLELKRNQKGILNQEQTNEKHDSSETSLVELKLNNNILLLEEQSTNYSVQRSGDVSNENKTRESLFGEWIQKQELERREKKTTNNKNSSSSDQILEEKLEADRKFQEQISDEMVQLASQLKNNSMAIYSQLQKDNRTLGNLDEKVNGNQTNLTKERIRIEEKLNSNFFSFLTLLSTMVFALIAVLVVYIFVIKPF